MTDSSVPTRPIGVWVIVVSYLFSAISTVLGLAWMHFSHSEFAQTLRPYLPTLTGADVFFMLLIEGTNLSASILLFRLSKRSVPLFLAALGLDVLQSAWAALAQPAWYDSALGSSAPSSSLLGAALGWVFSAAVCLYAWRLAKRGILR